MDYARLKQEFERYRRDAITREQLVAAIAEWQRLLQKAVQPATLKPCNSSNYFCKLRLTT